MPQTYTGRIVKPGNGAHPSLIDIAVGLSRQPRFAGQTRRQWSVLDHTLFGDELIKQETVGATATWEPTIRQRRLAWMLHDAHEAITGDVPTDVKGEELRSTQDQLDYRIADAFFPGQKRAFNTWVRDIKTIDHRCLLAEAHVVGPPDAGSVFEMPETADLTLLQGLLSPPLSAFSSRRRSFWGRPPFEEDQHNHPAVREYLHRMELLM